MPSIGLALGLDYQQYLGGSIINPYRTNLALELIGNNAPTGSVATWPDSSGSGNNATQSTSAQRPTGVASAINGHKKVLFDGVDDWLALAGISLITCEILAVVSQTGDQQLLSSDPPSNIQIRVGYPGNNIATYDGTNLPQSDTLAIAQGMPSILGYSISGGMVTFRQNGTGFGSGLSTPAVPVNRIGTDNGFFTFWNGYIAELIIYGDALSTPNRQAVEAYLAQKYAL